MKIRLLTFLAFVFVARSLEAQSTVNEQLELAERDFQRATLEKGVDGWNSFFADSGAQLQNTSHIVRGHAAIKELMGEFLASKTDRLIWWPVSAEVSASGDMAYTFGASGVVSADSTGKLGIAGRGTYLTVWRRYPRGNWKVTADMGGQASTRALDRAADTVAARTIRNIELQHSRAIENKDRNKLSGTYAYDFLGVTLDGRVTDYKSLLPTLSQVTKGVRYRSDVLNVTVAGETGIVEGTRFAFGDNMSDNRTSFLHIYVRRNGKWWLVREITHPTKQ